MDRRHPFYSQSPIIRRETGPFARWADLSGGCDVYGIVTFEMEIVWLRECHVTASLLRADGSELSSGSAYCDHSYGYLSCLRSIGADAVEMAHLFSCTSDSPLSVQVVLRVEELPAVSVPKDQYDSKYTEKYLSPPNDWCRPDDPAFIARSKAATWQERYDLPVPTYIGPRTVLEGPIWSSRNGLDDLVQAQMRDPVILRAIEGLPAEDADKARRRFDLADPTGQPVCGGRSER